VFKASEALCVKRITVGSKKAIAEQQNVQVIAKYRLCGYEMIILFTDIKKN
jgi:hypothetical protein